MLVEDTVRGTVNELLSCFKSLSSLVIDRPTAIDICRALLILIERDHVLHVSRNGDAGKLCKPQHTVVDPGPFVKAHAISHIETYTNTEEQLNV